MDNGKNNKNELLKEWTQHGQGHVFQFYDDLNEEEKKEFLSQVEGINVSETVRMISRALREKPTTDDHSLKPVVMVTSQDEEAHHKIWEDTGYQLYSKGEVAVLVMAGGQGTRLGTSYPKGTFDMNLLSGKSLFQIHAERILRLQELVFENTGIQPTIPWYIMLSQPVEHESKDFFKKHQFFGLKETQIIFFVQGEFPCIDMEGKILLDEKGKISTAPNGNGGIFKAMKEQGILKDMERRGVKIVASYIIDNILCKVGDPLFVGYSILSRTEIAVKVCTKAYPEERVGVVAMRDNVYTVLEYSEIDEKNRNLRDENGNLVFSASHSVICNFEFNFLKNFCLNNLHSLEHHLAKKAIPYVDSNGEKVRPKQVNGIKLELFSFDIFESAKRLTAFEIKRIEEFSPLKNSSDAQFDNPDTCRRDLSNLHKSWIENSGGKFEGEGLCEISPLVSYFGEGLRPCVEGKTFKLPFYLDKR